MRIWVIEWRSPGGTWVVADDDGVPWVYLSERKARNESRKYSRIAHEELADVAVEYRAVAYERVEASRG